MHMMSNLVIRLSVNILFFFFNDTATTEIYTLSLHDALPICAHARPQLAADVGLEQQLGEAWGDEHLVGQDRKSTRLNSSHSQISYAVFCLKKKKKKTMRLIKTVMKSHSYHTFMIPHRQ